MAADIKRREFISALAGATVWPLAARAQQPDKIRRLGVLPVGYRPDEPEGQARIAALLDTLRNLGWSDGRNIRVDIRWSGIEIDGVGAEISALVDSAPDAIVVSSNAALAILQKRNKTIPAVFVQISDPVGSGFVGSLAHPEGNFTGFQNFEPAIAGKWLGLLKEVAPAVLQAGVIVHPETAAHLEFLRAAEAVAPSLGVQVSAIRVRDTAETERGIAQFANTPNGGLIVLPHPVNINNRVLLAEMAARLRLPAIYPFNYYAASGGLVSYGFNQVEQWKGAAVYIDRILRGAKPADLPVQAPTKYELVINLRAAKELGLTISPSLLAAAHEVIE
jgi:putative tryptophan/tyrosine transport system substrate-binding protein